MKFLEHARRTMQTVVTALKEKKGVDVLVLDIQEQSLIADYFVIATGNSTVHLQALAQYGKEKLEEEGLTPLRTEGFREAQWILLDYGSVIVHLFLPDQRTYYNLERLWGDAKKLTEIT